MITLITAPKRPAKQRATTQLNNWNENIIAFWIILTRTLAQGGSATICCAANKSCGGASTSIVNHFYLSTAGGQIHSWRSYVP